MRNLATETWKNIAKNIKKHTNTLTSYAAQIPKHIVKPQQQAAWEKKHLSWQPGFAHDPLAIRIVQKNYLKKLPNMPNHPNLTCEAHATVIHPPPATLPNPSCALLRFAYPHRGSRLAPPCNEDRRRPSRPRFVGWKKTDCWVSVYPLSMSSREVVQISCLKATGKTKHLWSLPLALKVQDCKGLRFETTTYWLQCFLDPRTKCYKSRHWKQTQLQLKSGLPIRPRPFWHHCFFPHGFWTQSNMSQSQKTRCQKRHPAFISPFVLTFMTWKELAHIFFTFSPTFAERSIWKSWKPFETPRHSRSKRERCKPSPGEAHRTRRLLEKAIHWYNRLYKVRYVHRYECIKYIYLHVFLRIRIFKSIECSSQVPTTWHEFSTFY